MPLDIQRMSRKKSNRCPTCLLIAHYCLCSLVPSISVKTRVCLIIQSREVKKPNNTGLLAARCLTNSEVHIRGKVNSPVDYKHLVEDDYEPLFLFPGPGAVALTTEVVARYSRPIKLFVADGNWAQAQRIYRKFQDAAQVPSVFLPVGMPTQFKIRKAHSRPEGLATIEAVARALGIIEGSTEERQLTDIFMILVQRTLLSRGSTKTDI